MNHRRRFQFFLIIVLTLVPGLCCIAGENCTTCHGNIATGLADSHRFIQRPCTGCHGGIGNADNIADAHDGLEPFPGNLDNAAAACGSCHPAQVASVTASAMHTGTDMVQITRRAFGQETTADDRHSLQSLSQSPADSLLRKLCAGCHLGLQKTRHSHDVTRDRGGGCLACHLNDYAPDEHPALTLGIEDGRCFGCHSRSSRIALSYAGLAETDTASHGNKPASLSRLLDGRLVEHRPADSHHQAGLSCIDCHTGAGLMGMPANRTGEGAAVDIACTDCHDNRNPRIRYDDWPQQYRGMLERIPFKAAADQRFLVTANGTPLWHIEIRNDVYVLHLKQTAETRVIPPYRAQVHTLQNEHERLTCNACHARWAPQCYECHLDYSADEMQWDHVEQKPTAGLWTQRQGLIRNDLPALGVAANGEITGFVPGMIMSVDHPDYSEPLFSRLFGSISAHTTGPARSCESCHVSSVALGLGEGSLNKLDGRWIFTPEFPALQDGLPADAWTTLEANTPASGTRPHERSFNREEIHRILNSWRGDIHPDRRVIRSWQQENGSSR